MFGRRVAYALVDHQTAGLGLDHLGEVDVGTVEVVEGRLVLGESVRERLKAVGDAVFSPTDKAIRRPGLRKSATSTRSASLITFRC